MALFVTISVLLTLVVLAAVLWPLWRDSRRFVVGAFVALCAAIPGCGGTHADRGCKISPPGKLAWSRRGASTRSGCTISGDLQRPVLEPLRCGIELLGRSQ